MWLAGIALRGVAAFRIAHKNLFSRLPFVWAFLVVSVVRSAVLVWLRAKPLRYSEVGGHTMPMLLLSEAFAVVSVFWMVTENFPRWRKPGTILLLAMTLLGGSAAILLRTAWVPKDWVSGWASS